MKISNETRFIIIVIVLIIILLISFGLKVLKNSEFTPLSAEEIREKMLSYLNYDNFTLYYNKSESTRIKRVKDTIIVTTDPSTGTYSWADSSKKEVIAGNTITQKYVKVPGPTEFDFKKHFLYIEENLTQYGDNLYHIRNQKYNNRDCMVIIAGETKSETYFVDIETGFVLKYEASDGTKAEFSLKLNNVTDNDIKKYP